MAEELRQYKPSSGPANAEPLLPISEIQPVATLIPPPTTQSPSEPSNGSDSVSAHTEESFAVASVDAMAMPSGKVLEEDSELAGLTNGDAGADEVKDSGRFSPFGFTQDHGAGPTADTTNRYSPFEEFEQLRSNEQ